MSCDNTNTSSRPCAPADAKTFPPMHSTLCLQENVCTGAADGYFRMARRPAGTVLHLGPGLANAMSNLHNARRARSPILNIVGQMVRAQGSNCLDDS
eukprot:894143-Pelagomonas_calceolata.AAC.2